jgi:hypothetical protein
MMPMSAIPQNDSARPAAQPTTRPGTGKRVLGVSTGAGVLGGEGLAACLHPRLGEALAVADVIVPLTVSLVLLAAILLGSSQKCERVFRLLRWIANRPEPPSPAHEPSAR